MTKKLLIYFCLMLVAFFLSGFMYIKQFTEPVEIRPFGLELGQNDIDYILKNSTEKTSAAHYVVSRDNFFQRKLIKVNYQFYGLAWDELDQSSFCKTYFEGSKYHQTEIHFIKKVPNPLPIEKNDLSLGHQYYAVVNQYLGIVEIGIQLWLKKGYAGKYPSMDRSRISKKINNMLLSRLDEKYGVFWPTLLSGTELIKYPFEHSFHSIKTDHNYKTVAIDLLHYEDVHKPRKLGWNSGTKLSYRWSHYGINDFPSNSNIDRCLREFVPILSERKHQRKIKELNEKLSEERAEERELLEKNNKIDNAI